MPLAVNRLADAVRRRIAVARRRGDAVRCPLCGHSFDRFKDDWNRAGVLCWRCGSQERHRAQALLFDRRPELLGDIGSLLHLAPEWCLERKLRATPGLRYVTADLNPAGVDRQLDVTALDLPHGAFDAIVCSHVLEHVDDDAAAMAELRRVTAPNGWCLVMVPLDLARETTYEDASITDPDQRRRAFLQHDHVRLYTRDITDRLAAAGFAVQTIQLTAEMGHAADPYRLQPSDLIFLCRTPPAAA